MNHECAPRHDNGLFCGTCGKVLDREGLRSVKLMGFTGPASLVPSLERFWATGDPDGV